MKGKQSAILARRAIYVVAAYIIVFLCPSHYNQDWFYSRIGSSLTVHLIFIRSFTLVPILVLLISYLACGAIGFGANLKYRPGKKLTILSLVIAAVMLLGGLYVSCYFLLIGWLVLPKPLDNLWQDPGPLYMWWAVMGIFVQIGISNIRLLRRAVPNEGNPPDEDS